MATKKFNRKPPLPKSPVRQRPRRVLRSSNTTSAVQSPPGPGALTKSQKLNPAMEESELQLRALARLVNGEIGNDKIGDGITDGITATKSSPLFERGRFYEVYSARRNERLKRKKGGNFGEEAKTPYNLGVVADSCKKRDSKKLGSSRESMSAAYSLETSENTVPRYALRSMSKENKRPPLAAVNYERSAIASERKIGVKRGRKI